MKAVILTLFFSILTCEVCYGNEALLKSNVHCYIDINNDGNLDLALFVEKNNGGGELIALLKTEAGYEAHLIYSAGSYLNMSCQYGKYITETTAVDKDGKTFSTNGTYLQITQPESSSAAYYWDGKKFEGVMIAD